MRNRIFGLIAVLLMFSSVAYADCDVHSKIKIKTISIDGNHRTQSFVILRELEFKQEQEICSSDIDDSVERIKGTGLFFVVEYSLKPTSNNDADLHIRVTEKWTTIPILKVNSGGGVTQYTLGVYDPNIWGQYQEMGLQYENLAGTNSGVVWYKNPRLWGQHQGIDVQYWNTRRVRIKYDQEKDDAEIKTGFLHEREKIYFDYFREFRKEAFWRISFDYNKDSFSTKNLPKNVMDKVGTSVQLPVATELLLTKAGLEFGKLKGDAHLLRGYVLSLSAGYASPLMNNVDGFFQGDAGLVYHRPLSGKMQFAQRFLMGATSTKVLQYWYYLGGLDRIRGFSDNRFAARHYSLSNSEIRYLVMKKSSMHVQATGFTDILGSGEDASDIANLRAASVGAGIRLILPHFYRFVLRLDYAKPILKQDSMNWSFGVQQFF